MKLEEIENTLFIIKWVWPIISGCFFTIIALLIYIWKTDKSTTKAENKKRDETLRSAIDSLAQLTIMFNRMDVTVDNLKEKEA